MITYFVNIMIRNIEKKNKRLMNIKYHIHYEKTYQIDNDKLKQFIRYILNKHEQYYFNKIVQCMMFV